MKLILIITLSFISIIGNSQENQNHVQNDSIYLGNCKGGEDNARADFEKGIYNSYSYGLQIKITKKSEIGFDEFYEDYLKRKYSINIEHRGCVVTDYSTCYSNLMDRLILEKFGSDIFKKTRLEAKKIFNKRK
ncbi:hypothetical protein [Flavobacterium flavigenum]|uniref:hypothetical protein n=1 Tax=Flavobacterium flavigenum TaxID=3003258 RepID=UPI0022ABF20C|nr:hypothetical protein [Flavobacterium flavigenum]